MVSRPEVAGTPGAPGLDDALARIGRLDGALHAFTHLTPASGGPGLLANWPVALKDNVEVEGEPLGLGTDVGGCRIGQLTATVVRRLRDAGAAIVGRTHMVEYAFGGWGLNAALGAPRNPWDGRVHRVAGGSSSGAAVSVAAGMARLAVGTDTAGSVRMPAALCGITGFKPSFGRYPADGVFPLAPSFDTVGLFARSVSDIACADVVLAATSKLGTPSLGGRILAVLDAGTWPVPVQPAVRQALDEAARTFAALGLRLQTTRPPFDLDTLMRDAGTLIAAEAWGVHGPAFAVDPSRYGAEMQRRLHAASCLGTVAVTAARSSRALAASQLESWLNGPDAAIAVLLPTVPCSAPALNEVSESGSPLGAFARWVNHAGGCAISLPAGFDAEGLPLAIQLVAAGGRDADLLALAQAFQDSTGWHRRAPDLGWAT